MSRFNFGRSRVWCRLAHRNRRHRDGCDFCRVEEAAWEEVVGQLRQLGRQSAPPSLFNDVMAQIARERAEQTIGDPLALGRSGIEAGSDKGLVQDVIPLLILLGSWLLMIPTVPHLLDRLTETAAAALFTVRSAASEMIYGAGSAWGTALPTPSPGWGSVLVTIMWCGIGWAVTLAARVLASRLSLRA